MLSDNHGLALSTASPEAVAAFNRTLEGFLKYRLDTPQHLKQVFLADPEFGFAHCLQGYFGMLGAMAVITLGLIAFFRWRKWF